MSQSGVTSEVDAVVVGAGFSGLYQLYRLREQGLKVRVIEAGTGVGGTWYWNCYPGARTDSPSEVYQYWFSDELLNEWKWKERFPAQAETERYLNFVADRFDLRKHITFKTRVTAATWQENQARWTIATDTGEQISAQFFVACVGGLTAPVMPNIPGHESFKGRTLHTARWPREGIDLRDKRVGIIGTGATGIQVIQTIAPEVGHLTVFQRTANYTLPMRNPKYDERTFAPIRARYPEIRQRVRVTYAGFDEDLDYRDYKALPREERMAALQQMYEDGSLKFWIGGFKDLFFDPEVNEEISEFVRSRIRARIKDPAVAEKLIPKDHGFGTRRVPLETNYYEAFNRDNVLLVDLRTTPIEHFTERGVKTSDAEYPLDVLIFATGFDAGTGALSRIDIRGRSGVSLKETWQKDIRSMMGLQVHGFPNLFMTMAPLSPSAAFCNVPTCVQQQAEWIADCIQHVRISGHRAIEPTREAEDKWVAHHDELANMTLVSKTNSWYTGTNIEGKQHRLLPYVGGVGTYHQLCEEVKAKGYEGFALA